MLYAKIAAVHSTSSLAADSLIPITGVNAARSLLTTESDTYKHVILQMVQQDGDRRSRLLPSEIIQYI